MRPAPSTLALRNASGLAAPAPASPLALVTDGRIVPLRAPDARTADGYLRLAAHLLLEGERRGFRTVGVVSALRGEGRSTAALNLAACLGRTRGREGRVLLVDGDARSRTLTRLLGGEHGATAQTPFLAATGFEGVDFLSAPGTEDRFRLHAPAAWARVLSEVSARYPHVVVDCPAILDDPEGVVLRECVDVLVVVVEVGRTTRRAVEAAAGGVARRVVGVILNGDDGRAVAAHRGAR